VSYASGINGEAISFDGVDDYVKLPTKLFDGNPKTISFWFKTEDQTAALISAPSSKSDNHYLSFLSGSSLHQWVYPVRGESVSLLSDGEWHNLTVVIDAEEFKVYVDAVLQYSKLAIAKLNLSVSNVFLGAEADCISGCFESSQYYSGLLDELKVFNKALTLRNIKQLMLD